MIISHFNRLFVYSLQRDSSFEEDETIDVISFDATEEPEQDKENDWLPSGRRYRSCATQHDGAFKGVKQISLKSNNV